MDYTITSKDNKLIKHIKLLHQKKYRDSEKQFFVEGIKIVQEAIEVGTDICSLIVCPDTLQEVSRGKEILADIYNSKLNIELVPENVFKHITDTESPQGILAVIKKAQKSVEDFIPDENGFYILIDKLQDPGNAGTIIRTAEAAGVDGILFSEGSVDVYSPKTLRASMGSIFRIVVLEGVCLQNIIKIMKNKGIKIIASTLKSNEEHYNLDCRGGAGLIIGSESHGIEEKLLRLADYKVKIPMCGKIESLNASIAAGILMYEILKTHRN